MGKCSSPGDEIIFVLSYFLDRSFAVSVKHAKTHSSECSLDDVH